jgi:hypothetical protein
MRSLVIFPFLRSNFPFENSSVDNKAATLNNYSHIYHEQSLKHELLSSKASSMAQFPHTIK